MHKHSVLGGTFDHFHKGHERFLTAALEKSQKLTIGITSDEMISKKAYKESVESYSKREQSVRDFVSKNNFSDQVIISKIEDIYGPSITDTTIDAIYVISDTYDGAVKVNKKRESLGLKKLEIVEVPTLNINNTRRISSTEIRLGRIDRQGNHYAGLFPKNKMLILPESLRTQLKEPFGKVSKSIDIKLLINTFTIAVGDIVVSDLYKKGVIPNICVFDRISNREIIVNSEILNNLPTSAIQLDNKPGSVNCTTALKINDIIQESIESNLKFSIEIRGEEDLLALPAMLFAPLNSLVIYGLQEQGAVAVTVTEKLKREIADIISQWTISKY